MKTILVAEDRDASRELIRTVLTAAGYNVVEARDGQEAVERAVVTTTDLVLLDLYMPHLDGFAVLAALRARAEYAHVPVIALTASAMAGDRERAIESGFSEYISKPVNMAYLRREIHRLLGSPEQSSPEQNSLEQNSSGPDSSEKLLPVACKESDDLTDDARTARAGGSL